MASRLPRNWDLRVLLSIWTLSLLAPSWQGAEGSGVGALGTETLGAEGLMTEGLGAQGREACSAEGLGDERCVWGAEGPGELRGEVVDGLKGQRSLKELVGAGWTDLTRPVPPHFVQWTRTSTPHPFKLSELGFNATHFSCEDSVRWRVGWPPLLAEGRGCEAFEMGAEDSLNSYCKIDLGKDYEEEGWVLAEVACPRACDVCSQRFCNRSVVQEALGMDRMSCYSAIMARNASSDYMRVLDYVDTQPELRTLALATTSTQNLPNNTLELYQQHLEQNGYSAKMYQALAFHGGQFLENVSFSIVSLNPGSAVRHTIDGSEPTFTHGILGTDVTLDRNARVKAIALSPSTGGLVSDSVSLEIRVKVLAPRVFVERCESETGEILFNETRTYQGELCTALDIRITAMNQRVSETLLRFSDSGGTPIASNPQGQTELFVRVAKPGVVSAIAWIPDMVPSQLAQTPYLHVVSREASAFAWMGTVGFWNLSSTTLGGSYSRPRATDVGCNEQHPTLITPAEIRDESEGLGPAVLKGPDCKGGVWDLEPGLSPSLQTFVRDEGLYFDGILNRGLFVSEDITTPRVRNLLPESELSVETWFSVEPGVGTTLGGLVSCRLDATAAGGFRYSKGWDVGYSASLEDQTLTVILSLALEGNEIRPGLGGIRDFYAPVALPTMGELVYAVATYDGENVRIWVDGVLETEERACPLREEPGCGIILYPKEGDGFFTQGKAASFSIGVIDSLDQTQVAPHFGLIRMLRVMRAAMSQRQVDAGMTRLGVSFRFQECLQGTYGPYEGLEPCYECSPGFISEGTQNEACEACVQGFFAASEGSHICLLCPPGTGTPGEGYSVCVEDECVLGTADCHPNATCSNAGSGPGSYRCTCNPGFEGDGFWCQGVCGDGNLVEGELCDDGNLWDSDGCSHDCTPEFGFECQVESGGQGLISNCECKLPADECCSLAHAVCHQRIKAGLAENYDCLSNLATCQAAILQGAKEPVPYAALGSQNAPGAVSCNADQERDCNLLWQTCQGSEALPSACLSVYMSCLKAVECS